MILCDTNILIEFYKNNANVVQELRAIGSNRIAISAITVAELYFGALNKQELSDIRRHLSTVRQYPIDEVISSRFLTLMESFALSHKPSVPDALIGATALVHGCEIYTLNTRDFVFLPGIRLYSPKTY